MSRTTITTEGAICFKTKNLPLHVAASFARCIQANATRFTAVEIDPSKSKKADLFSVQFRPVNPERQADLYMAEWDKNQQRADEEGADYIYFHNADNPAVTFVFNPKSGQTWEMFNGFCQCPHKLYRCVGAALQCKHELEKERRARIGIPMDGSDKVTPNALPPASTYADVVDGRVVRRRFQTGEIVEERPEERRARLQATISRDF